jgi:hypothetical protein
VKHELYLEATIAADNNLLVRIAEVMYTVRLSPESLIWSELPGSGEARIWMIVGADEAQSRELLAKLRQISGVTQIAMLGPGQALIKSLFGW